MREEAATIIAAFLWGTSFVAIKYGLEFVDPYMFVFLRFLAAFIIVAVLLPILGMKPNLSLYSDRLIVWLGIANAAGYIIEYLGMALTSAIKASLLLNLGFIFVAVFSYYFLNERFSKTKGTSIILAAMGVFLLTTKGNLAMLHSDEFLGDAIVILSGLVWAVFMILNKKAVERHSLVDIVFFLEAYTAILLFPLLIFSETHVTPGIVALTSGMAIFYSIIPFVLYSYGLRKISATASAIMLLLEILFAAIFAYLFLQERLGAYEIGGGILIFAAIWFIMRE